MNVLVYAGNETVHATFTRTVAGLKSILLPNYSVQPITAQTLSKEPWASNCALLVFPQCRRFKPIERISKPIVSYVMSGGSFLVLSAGATIHRGPPTDLETFLRFANADGYVVVPDFHDPLSEDKIEKFSVQFEDGLEVEGVEQHAGHISGSMGNMVSILARCQNTPVSIITTVSLGRVAVASPSVELVNDDLSQPLRSILKSLGLSVPESSTPQTLPLPQILLCSPDKPALISSIVGSIQAALTLPELKELKDDHDHFHFHPISERSQIAHQALEKKLNIVDLAAWPKHILIPPEGWVPGKEDTPVFDLTLFFAQHSKTKNASKSPDGWVLGDVLFYSEVVTSTQTLLDKNPLLLDALPAPLVSIASRQLSGRGRGSNTWLSPAGCLQFSLLLRVDLASFPANKLVFVQYLFALAVAEACRHEDILGQYGDAVRLKWPNDLYSLQGKGAKKIGGILVNTTFKGGKVDIIIGCGLNVLNAAPIMSLSQLLPPEHTPEARMEKVAAVILSTFDEMWGGFTASKGSFEPFMDLYLERWLHSDQLVTLTTLEPPQAVRVVGITPDHGLLRTMPEGGWSSQFYDLQPDGNSFDLMAGLIRSKG